MDGALQVAQHMVQRQQCGTRCQCGHHNLCIVRVSQTLDFELPTWGKQTMSMEDRVLRMLQTPVMLPCICRAYGCQHDGSQLNLTPAMSHQRVHVPTHTGHYRGQCCVRDQSGSAGSVR